LPELFDHRSGEAGSLGCLLSSGFEVAGGQSLLPRFLGLLLGENALTDGSGLPFRGLPIEYPDREHSFSEQGRRSVEDPHQVTGHPTFGVAEELAVTLPQGREELVDGVVAIDRERAPGESIPGELLRDNEVLERKPHGGSREGASIWG